MASGKPCRQRSPCGAGGPVARLWEHELNAQPLSATDLRWLLLVLRSGRLRHRAPPVSPLLDRAVAAQDRPDTPELRWWLLDRLLADMIWHHIEELRSDHRALSLHDVRQRHGAERVKLLFDRTCLDSADGRLAAWSAIYCRYFDPVPSRSDEIAGVIGVHVRTVQRWLRQGRACLREAIYDAEQGLRPASVPSSPTGETLSPGCSDVSHLSAPDAAGHASALVDGGAAATVLGGGQGVAGILGTGLGAEAGNEEACGSGDSAGEGPGVQSGLVDSHTSGAPLLAACARYRARRVALWSGRPYLLDGIFTPLRLSVMPAADTAAPGPATTRTTSLFEALQSHDAHGALVLGPPGCGKTTLMRHTDLLSARNGVHGGTARQLFLVQLSQYREGRQRGGRSSPLEWLANRWSIVCPELPDLVDILEMGALDVLVDGLGTLPHVDEEEYWSVVTSWRSLAAEIRECWPGNRLVFATRIGQYTVPLEELEHRVVVIRIEPMDDDQVWQFVSKRIGDPAPLLDAVDRIGLRELFRLPFNLDYLTGLWQTDPSQLEDTNAVLGGLLRQSIRREMRRGNPLFRPGYLLGELDCRRLALECPDAPEPWELRGPRHEVYRALAREMTRRESAGETGIDPEILTAVSPGPLARDALRALEDLGVVAYDEHARAFRFVHEALRRVFMDGFAR